MQHMKGITEGSRLTNTLGLDPLIGPARDDGLAGGMARRMIVVAAVRAGLSITACLSGSPVEVRRSGGRIRHPYTTGGQGVPAPEKYERTPPGRLASQILRTLTADPLRR